ncbi:MAG: hypothetical protein HGA23_05710, partial [Bacteroidales bacterium]|nr:hypothetical protein [Bacteroidales bacterium]
FDKASGASLLFADSKYDLSDDVLDEIGTVMQTVRRESRTRQTVQIGTTQSSTTPGTGQMAPQPRPNQGSTGTNTGQQNYNSGNMDSGKDVMPPPPGEKKK